MPTVAQGVAATLKRVKQSALGSPGSTGSQYMRRVTFAPAKQAQTYESQEIVNHQQSTGATQGPSQIVGTLNGELSPGTYALETAALLRRDFAAAFTPIAAASLTIAGAGPTYTVTRAAGSWLTDGVKAGMAVRLSVGALNAANLSKNLVVMTATATVLTVFPWNGVALVAEGPITGCTISGPGKETHPPTSAHTNDYFSWERWFGDASFSDLYTDVKPASMQVTIPATGNPTISIPMSGLGRTIGTAEVLTSPSAATTTNLLATALGKIVINGVVTTVTNIQFTIDGTTSTGEAEVGSATFSDLQRGRIKASGQFSAKFSSQALQTLRDNQTVVRLIVGAADSASATADFILVTFPAIKVMTDDADDGEKQIVRTYQFTAQYFGAGGAGTDSNQTIVQIQDSQAP
jgi:hypothetical protein